VTEAPDGWVWLGSQQELRFGTAGEDLEFGNLVWPKGDHVLRIENKGLCKKFLGRLIAEQTILMGRMNQK
jgi:hypothetical protein